MKTSKHQILLPQKFKEYLLTSDTKIMRVFGCTPNHKMSEYFGCEERISWDIVILHILCPKSLTPILELIWSGKSGKKDNINQT